MKSSRWFSYISALPRQPYSLLYWYLNSIALIMNSFVCLYWEELEKWIFMSKVLKLGVEMLWYFAKENVR